MALHTEDMSQVPDFGELVPEFEGYHVRVSKVEERESSTGNPVAFINCKVQTEGEAFGRNISIIASLQPHALGTLKAVYKASGYTPGPEGHDPEHIIDAEFYVNVVHEKYNGQDVAKVPNWSIRSLDQGPARSKRSGRSL